MRGSMIALVALSLHGAAIAQAPDVAAQRSLAPTANGNAPTGGQCLTRKWKDGNGADRDLSIAVPSSQVAALTERGFVSVSCASVNVAQVRARVCRLALKGNDAVQKRLEQVLGASPAMMCRAIKAISPFPRDPTGGSG